MSVSVVFNQMMIIFLLMMTGVLLYKKSIITDESSKLLSNLIVTAFNPAMIISGALDRNGTGGMREILFVMMIACLMFVTLIILGHVIPVILRVPQNEKSIYNMMTVFGNIGFIGIPVTAAILGKSAVIYIVLFNLPFSILIYTYGIYLITKGTDKRPVYSLKSLINIGTVSSVIAIFIFIFKVRFPDPIESAVNYLGSATTSLSMISMGVSLAQIPLRKIFTDIRLYMFAGIRLLIIPICSAVMLKPLIADPLIYGVTILMIAMPCGSMPVILAQTYGVNSECAARTVVLTTILSLGTISAVSLFM
ncbi:MAG: AEC family transporter [Clostridium sp.]|nr:AEC family transporter [Clostridium sp.]